MNSIKTRIDVTDFLMSAKTVNVSVGGGIRGKILLVSTDLDVVKLQHLRRLMGTDAKGVIRPVSYSSITATPMELLVGYFAGAATVLLGWYMTTLLLY